MKKFAFTLILAVLASVAVIGCTEQEIKPKVGGTIVTSDPIK